MKTLAFVWNMLQWEQLRQGHWGDITVSSADFDVLDAVGASGGQAASLWDHLDDSVAEANEQKTLVLCAELRRTLRGLLRVGDWDIAEFAIYDMEYPIRLALNASCAVRSMLASFRPERAVVFAETAQPFIWDPVTVPPDVFNAVARWQVEHVGVRCELQRLHVKDEAPPLSSRRAPPPRLPPQVEVVDIADGLGLAEQRCLLDRVARDGKPWLILPFAEEVSPFACVARVPLLSAPLLRMARLGSAQIRAQVREGVMRMAVQDVDGILCNRHLGFLWDHLGWLLDHGLAQFGLAEWVTRALRPRFAVFGYNVQGASRCLRAGFMRCAVPTLSINHSGLSPVVAYRRHRGDLGALAVWGRREEDLVRRERECTDAIHLFGSLRRDVADMLERGRVARVEKFRKSPQGDRPRILLLTARIADLSAVSVSPSRHWRTWEELGALVRRYPEWDFVIKPHPRYDYSRLYTRPDFRAFANLSVASGELAAAVEQADVVITVNTMTTACLEPLAQGVPLIALEPAVFARHRGQLAKAADTVFSVAELEPVLRRCLFDAEHRRARTQAGFAFLDGVITRAGDATADAVLAHIESAVRKAPASLPPDPVARWYLDYFAALGHVRAGRLRWPEFIQATSQGRPSGSALAATDLFDVAQVAACAVEYLLAESWGEARRPWLPHMVWQLCRRLPRDLRPDGPTLRQLVRLAVDAESRRDDRPRWCTALHRLARRVIG